MFTNRTFVMKKSDIPDFNKLNVGDAVIVGADGIPRLAVETQIDVTVRKRGAKGVTETATRTIKGSGSLGLPSQEGHEKFSEFKELYNQKKIEFTKVIQGAFDQLGKNYEIYAPDFFWQELHELLLQVEQFQGSFSELPWSQEVGVYSLNELIRMGQQKMQADTSTFFRRDGQRVWTEKDNFDLMKKIVSKLHVSVQKRIKLPQVLGKKESKIEAPLTVDLTLGPRSTPQASASEPKKQTGAQKMGWRQSKKKKKEKRKQQQHSQQHPQQHPQQHSQQHPQQHPQQHSKQHPQQHPQQRPQQHSQQHPKQHPQQHQQKHTQQHPQQHPQQRQQKHTQQHTQQHPQQNQHQHQQSALSGRSPSLVELGKNEPEEKAGGGSIHKEKTALEAIYPRLTSRREYTTQEKELRKARKKARRKGFEDPSVVFASSIPASLPLSERSVGREALPMDVMLREQKYESTVASKREATDEMSGQMLDAYHQGSSCVSSELQADEMLFSIAPVIEYSRFLQIQNAQLAELHLKWNLGLITSAQMSQRYFELLKESYVFMRKIYYQIKYSYSEFILSPLSPKTVKKTFTLNIEMHGFLENLCRTDCLIQGYKMLRNKNAEVLRQVFDQASILFVKTDQVHSICSENADTFSHERQLQTPIQGVRHRLWRPVSMQGKPRQQPASEEEQLSACLNR